MIACVLYDELWIKYATYLEPITDVEAARQVYKRALEIHVPLKPDIHLALSAFEENKRDFEVAVAILSDFDRRHPQYTAINLRQISIERRRLEKAERTPGMPRLPAANEVLMEICRFFNYNDLNVLALTSRQLQACVAHLHGPPIARMQCLEVSIQGFTLHYSPTSSRKRLFPTFEEFALCARKVRPKIHTMELVNVHHSDEEDTFLSKLLSIEVYHERVNLVQPQTRLRFYCTDVMYEMLGDHSEACALEEDWQTVLHECHALKIELYDDPRLLELITSGLAQENLQEHSHTFLTPSF